MFKGFKSLRIRIIRCRKNQFFSLFTCLIFTISPQYIVANTGVIAVTEELFVVIEELLTKPKHFARTTATDAYPYGCCLLRQLVGGFDAFFCWLCIHRVMSFVVFISQPPYCFV